MISMSNELLHADYDLLADGERVLLLLLERHSLTTSPGATFQTSVKELSQIYSLDASRHYGRVKAAAHTLGSMEIMKGVTGWFSAIEVLDDKGHTIIATLNPALESHLRPGKARTAFRYWHLAKYQNCRARRLHQILFNKLTPEDRGFLLTNVFTLPEIKALFGTTNKHHVFDNLIKRVIRPAMDRVAVTTGKRIESTTYYSERKAAGVQFQLFI